MSLGNLHNPKAAADLIAEFKKKYKTKVCMSPFENHEGPIISAHTLSLEAVLRKVSEKGHVYALHTNVYSPDMDPINLKLTGLRDVSVFNGFCSFHDAKLFSCLENEQFKFSHEQLFMLAYRSVSRECYLNRQSAESIPLPDKIQTIHGISEKLEFSVAALQMQAMSLQGALDIEKLKESFDRYLLNSSWTRLVSHAVIFPEKTSLVSSFVFQPFYSLNGTKLQCLENLDEEMSQLIVSVLPLNEGSAAIFSWLDTANSAPRKYFESVVESKNITSSIMHVILDNSENFALSPIWYNALSAECKYYILSRIRKLYVNNVSRPEQTAPDLGNWGNGIITSF